MLFGPVSSARGRPGPLEYIFFGGLACFVVWSLARDWKRSKRIRQYAQGKGFLYIGAYLPSSFPFSETSVNWAGSTANAVDGDRGGKRVLFFDCKLGSGKGRRTQTVVAVRAAPECFSPGSIWPFMTTERIGDWALFYRSKERLPLVEIDALLAEV